MNKKISVLYSLNIIFQAIFDLVLPTALAFLLAMLFIGKLGAPKWLYAIFIPIGAVIGFVAMIRFIITACAGLERLEKQGKTGGGKNGKRK